MIIYFDIRFELSNTQLIWSIIKVEIGVTEQFSVIIISSSSSILEMQLVYKTVHFNLTSVNAA